MVRKEEPKGDHHPTVLFVFFTWLIIITCLKLFRTNRSYIEYIYN